MTAVCPTDSAADRAIEAMEAARREAEARRIAAEAQRQHEAAEAAAAGDGPQAAPAVGCTAGPAAAGRRDGDGGDDVRRGPGGQVGDAPAAAGAGACADTPPDQPPPSTAGSRDAPQCPTGPAGPGLLQLLPNAPTSPRTTPAAPVAKKAAAPTPVRAPAVVPQAPRVRPRPRVVYRTVTVSRPVLSSGQIRSQQAALAVKRRELTAAIAAQKQEYASQLASSMTNFGGANAAANMTSRLGDIDQRVAVLQSRIAEVDKQARYLDTLARSGGYVTRTVVQAGIDARDAGATVQRAQRASDLHSLQTVALGSQSTVATLQAMKANPGLPASMRPTDAQIAQARTVATSAQGLVNQRATQISAADARMPAVKKVLDANDWGTYDGQQFRDALARGDIPRARRMADAAGKDAGRFQAAVDAFDKQAGPSGLAPGQIPDGTLATDRLQVNRAFASRNQDAIDLLQQNPALKTDKGLKAQLLQAQQLGVVLAGRIALDAPLPGLATQYFSGWQQQIAAGGQATLAAPISMAPIRRQNANGDTVYVGGRGLDVGDGRHVYAFDAATSRDGKAPTGAIPEGFNPLAGLGPMSHAGLPTGMKITPRAGDPNTVDVVLDTPMRIDFGPLPPSPDGRQAEPQPALTVTGASVTLDAQGQRRVSYRIESGAFGTLPTTYTVRMGAADNANWNLAAGYSAGAANYLTVTEPKVATVSGASIAALRLAADLPATRPGASVSPTQARLDGIAVQLAAAQQVLTLRPGDPAALASVDKLAPEFALANEDLQLEQATATYAKEVDGVNAWLKTDGGVGGAPLLDAARQRLLEAQGRHDLNTQGLRLLYGMDTAQGIASSQGALLQQGGVAAQDIGRRLFGQWDAANATRQGDFRDKAAARAFVTQVLQASRPDVGKESIDRIVDNLFADGQQTAHVEATPVFSTDERGQVLGSVLFRVDTPGHKAQYVGPATRFGRPGVTAEAPGFRLIDIDGSKYTSEKDYRDNNNTMRAPGMVWSVMAPQGTRQYDASGRLVVSAGDARIESGYERFSRQHPYVEPVANVAITVAGVALTASGVGAEAGVPLLALRAASLGRSALVLTRVAQAERAVSYGRALFGATGAYYGLRAADNRLQAAEHGRSQTDSAAVLDYLTMVGMGTGAAGKGIVKAAYSLSARGAGLGAADAGYSLAARGAGAVLRGGGRTLAALPVATNLAPLGYGTLLTASDWSRMTPEQRQVALVNMSANGLGLAQGGMHAALGHAAQRRLARAGQPMTAVDVLRRLGPRIGGGEQGVVHALGDDQVVKFFYREGEQPGDPIDLQGLRGPSTPQDAADPGMQAAQAQHVALAALRAALGPTRVVGSQPPIWVGNRPAIVMDRMAGDVEATAPGAPGAVDTVPGTHLPIDERRANDLRQLRDQVRGAGVWPMDPQFLVDGSNRVVLADPLGLFAEARNGAPELDDAVRTGVQVARDSAARRAAPGTAGATRFVVAGPPRELADRGGLALGGVGLDGPQLHETVAQAKAAAMRAASGDGPQFLYTVDAGRVVHPADGRPVLPLDAIRLAQARELDDTGHFVRELPPPPRPDRAAADDPAAPGAAAPAPVDQAYQSALLAQDVYNRSLFIPKGSAGVAGWTDISGDAARLRPFGLSPADLNPRLSGFRARLYLPDAALGGQGFKPQLVFRGTELGGPAVAAHWGTNLRQGLGLRSSYHRQAALIGQRLRSAGADLTIAGHSLGGGLAAIAAQTSGLDANTFNAAGVHGRTLDDPVIASRLADRPGRVTAYQVAGDPLTFAQSRGPIPAALGQAEPLPGPRPATLYNHMMAPAIDALAARRAPPAPTEADTGAAAGADTPSFDLHAPTIRQPPPPSLPRLVHGDRVPLLEGINPGQSRSNCVNCAVATEYKLRTGRNVRARASDPRDAGFVDAVLGSRRILRGGMDQLREVMRAAGPGAHAFVTALPERADGIAHVFNATTDAQGQVVLLDGQVGRAVRDVTGSGGLLITPTTQPTMDAYLANLAQRQAGGPGRPASPAQADAPATRFGASTPPPPSRRGPAQWWRQRRVDRVAEQSIVRANRRQAPAAAAVPQGGSSVRDPNRLHLDNERLLEGPAAAAKAVARPGYVGAPQGTGLNRGDVAGLAPADPAEAAARQQQIAFLLGPSPDGSFNARGLRSRVRGLQTDHVAKLFVVAAETAPMRNGRSLDLVGNRRVYSRAADALRAAQGVAAGAPGRRAYVYAVQDDTATLAEQVRRGAFPHDALAGAVAVDPQGRIFAKSWANRQHGRLIPAVGQRFRTPPTPPTGRQWAGLIATHATLEGGAIGSAVLGAHAAGLSLTQIGVAGAAAFLHRATVPVLQARFKTTLGRRNRALASILDDGRMPPPNTNPVALDREYRRALIGRERAGLRGNRVPIARRAAYADALATLVREPRNAAARATLAGAGVDFHRREWDQLLRRSRKFLSSDEQRALGAAMGNIRRSAQPAQADPADWARVRAAALQDMARRHDGFAGVRKGLTERADYRLAGELLGLNPQDTGARSLLAAAPGNMYRPNTLAGGALTLTKPLSFAISFESYLDRRILNTGRNLEADPLFNRYVLSAAGIVPNALFSGLNTARAGEEIAGADVQARPGDAATAPTYRANLGLRRMLTSWSPAWRTNLAVEHDAGVAKPTWLGARLALTASRIDTGVMPLWMQPDYQAMMAAFGTHHYATALQSAANLVSWAVMTRGMHKDMINTFRGTRGMSDVHYLSRLTRWFDALPANEQDMVRKGLPPGPLILAGTLGITLPVLAPAMEPVLAALAHDSSHGLEAGLALLGHWLDAARQAG